MTDKTKWIAILIGIFVIVHSSVMAQWQSNADYGMKINIPSDWTKKAYMDGTDQVYDFYSADQNAAVQLRAFKADASLSTDLIIQVYEQAMLPEGTQRLSLKDHVSVQGIAGKQAIYDMNYNGNGVSMAAFYTIQNRNAYVLTAIVPTQLLEQKMEEVKKVTQSFTIEGISPVTTAPVATRVIPQTPHQGSGVRPGQQGAGPRPNSQNDGAQTNSQSTGARPSSSHANSTSSSLSIYGTYHFQSRSDGKKLTNYHFIQVNENGTYEESYEPSHSPGYQGGDKGTWEKKNGKLYLKPKGGVEAEALVIEPNELIRKTSTGIIFWFKK